MNNKYRKIIIVLLVSLVLVGIINVILYIDKPSDNYLIYSVILSVYTFSVIPSIIIGYKQLSKILLDGVGTLGLFLGIIFFLISSIIFTPYGMIKYYLKQFLK